MNAKRWMKWVVVLFLLVVLPSLTVVLAQEQEPADGSEDILVPYAPESCGYQQRIELNAGYIFRDKTSYLTLSSPTLVYLEATNLREFKIVGTKPGEIAHYTDRRDVRELYNLPAGDYCITVWSAPGQPPHYIPFTSLLVANPVLISASAAGLRDGGTVGGIPFFSEDILAHIDIKYPDASWPDDLWRMIFDGSDLGVSANVTNIAVGNQLKPPLIMSFAAEQTLRYAGLIKPQDIVYFTPWSIGPTTEGRFEMAMRGSEHDLTGSNEKLDAIDGWINGYDRCFGYPVSTTGLASVMGWGSTMEQDDEDVFCKVFDEGAGGWRPYDWFFDVKGAHNAPAGEPAPGVISGFPAEDVFAMAYDESRDRVYLTILGTGTIAGNRVTQSDIFAISYPNYKWGGFVWKGSEHGFNYKIDAIELSNW